MTLSKRFTGAELVRMLGLIQTTAAGFVRSASRRMDAELCIVNLCQPELQLNAESLNARLTRLEDQIKSGSFKVSVSSSVEEQEEYPPMPDDRDAPPDLMNAVPLPDETPAGFWTEICAQVRKELKPPVSGFFTMNPNGPVQGQLKGNLLVLVCANAFAKDMIDKPEVLELVSRKASAKMGQPIRVKAYDKNTANETSEQMEKLLQFGRAHSDVINIK